MKRKRKAFVKVLEKVKLVLVNIRFRLDISMPVMVTNPGIGFGAWQIAPARLSFITSSLIASACSLDGRRGGYFLGAMEGLMLKLWQMKAGSIPGASQVSHANTSIFLLRNSTNSSFSWEGNWAPIWKNFSESPLMTTFSRSSHFAPSTAVLRDGTGAINYYKSFSTGVEDSASSRCEMEATIHYLAVGW